jgi:hypothetical protein
MARRERGWFGGVGVLCAVLAFAVGSVQPGRAAEDPKQFIINGPLYRRIVLLKDLVADILPPPAYIIESHLVVNELLDLVEKGAPPKDVANLIEYGRILKEGVSPKGELAGYFERLEFWTKELPANSPEYAEIREWMLDKSAEAVKKYFEIRDQKFVAALKGSDPSKSPDLGAAKAILRSELSPLYERHRAAVDQVVSRAETVAKKLERDVVTLVAKGDLSKVLIGGPYYKDIIRMKDLIADILPPPCYIIESHLISHMAIDATERGDKETAVKLLERSRQLKEGMSIKKETAGFLERQTFWKASLAGKTEAEAKIKDLMVRGICEPALKFFEAREALFVPAIQKGDAPAAKKAFREALDPRYREHRKLIDELVAMANKAYSELMAEVDSKVGAK